MSDGYPAATPGERPTWPLPEQAPYPHDPYAQAPHPQAPHPQDPYQQQPAGGQPYAGQAYADQPYPSPPYPQQEYPQQGHGQGQQQEYPQQQYGQAPHGQALYEQPQEWPQPQHAQPYQQQHQQPQPYQQSAAYAPAQPYTAAPFAAPGPGPVGAPFAAPAAPRSGSPIIEPGLQPALITAAVAALLAGGAALGSFGLAIAVALLQALTAAGWFRLNGMWPARQGIALAALAGFTADVAVLLVSGDGGAAAVVGTLGGFFLLLLVLQTFRPSDPAERFYALTVLGSATLVTVLCGALLLAQWVPAAVGAVALATVLAAAPLPGPKALGPVLGLLAAAGFGLLVGAPVALGALAGVGALVGRRVAAYDFPSRFVHMTAGVALPLAVASPLIWIGSRLLGG
ncbi:hypothetical protein [Kitasatospora sp. NBC_00315]|uniref:hypothetical protein n=1 Tax=Kitasatospora sp. NBC_00315 TaxID=2975963 RepID=UPI003255A2E2